MLFPMLKTQCFFMLQKISQRFFRGYLEEGEEIITTIHRHWMAILKRSLRILFFFVIIPGTVYFVFPYPFIFGLFFLFALYAVAKFFYAFFNWYLDVWILTNMAILDIRWDGFFKRSAQRSEYARIEQVSHSYNGVFQSLLNYGTLHIQQAGGVDSIVSIVNPKQAASDIATIQEKLNSSQKFQDEEALKDILTGIIKRHIEKHGVSVPVDE